MLVIVESFNYCYYILPLFHCLRGERTGIYDIDSTKLQICNNKRTHNRGIWLKCERANLAGWFMGFKLHLIINQEAKLFLLILLIMAIKFTKGNKSDIPSAFEI